MSGRCSSARGSLQSSAPFSATCRDRSSASPKIGLCVSGHESELPLAKRETVSTPAETNTSPSPARMACIAMRVVCSDDEQYRLTVVPGTVSYPSRTATTRAMLKPCSPPGSPQPSARSSIWVGSSWGTWASAARTICTVRSSGRMVVSEPLNARPMGERAAATMTASGIDFPPRRMCSDFTRGPRPRAGIVGGPCHSSGMASWSEIEAAEPAFAARVRELFDAEKHKTIATVGADLRRDPRFALHSASVAPPEGQEARWAGDAKVAGLAVPAGPIEGEGVAGELYRADLREVVLTRLNPTASALRIEWWTPERGLRSVER